MKKVIYAILFSLVTCITISSCTEEQIEPKTELDNGGGSAIEKVG
ncbi:MAG: hypothetical protein ACOYXT_28190 [Bacteroidota bacterium]